MRRSQVHRSRISEDQIRRAGCVDKALLNYDFVISIGVIEPHLYAGYSAALDDSDRTCRRGGHKRDTRVNSWIIRLSISVPWKGTLSRRRLGIS